MNAFELITFERAVADHFEKGDIHGPVHLSGGNEEQLIEIFKNIHRDDWVFSTWRSHYHALLHGIPGWWVAKEIIEGRSINLKSAKHRFFTSAIVGGILPIAVGVAAAIKRQGGETQVWCFIGDMAASIGTVHDAFNYADGNDLPITFVIEDNGLSVCTPTEQAWGKNIHFEDSPHIMRYHYQATLPHYGVAKGTTF